MDYDRYTETQNRERALRSERSSQRQGSIFGRQEDRWGDRYDRNWRDSDYVQSRRQDIANSPRRAYAEQVGLGRSTRVDRNRRDYERGYGPDDYREDLPRDETSHLIASNKVEGTAVYGRDGERLGTIYNFMVDKRSGRVEYAVMSYGGMLGMGTRYYPVPWSMLTYHTDVGGYEVDLTERDLERAPSFDERTEPRFDRSYGRSVYDFYGLYY